VSLCGVVSCKRSRYFVCINIDVVEIGWEDVDWICQPQDSKKVSVFNMVMSLGGGL